MESLIGQTLREIEIICVDDGSTDDSPAILAEYAAQDKRVHVFRQTNKGQSAARNFALHYAAAPYVMFCDSDDSYEPTMCAEMLKTVQSRPEVDMGECGYSVVCERGVSEIASPEIPEQVVEAPRAPIVYCPWNKIFKREIIEQFDIVFPGIRVGEDAAFCENYLTHCRLVACTKKSLYEYRQWKGSTMHTVPEKRSSCADQLQIAEIIFEHHKTWGKLTERSSRLWSNFSALYWSAIETAPCGKIQADITRASKEFVQCWLPQVSAEEVPPHVAWLLSCLRLGKTPEYVRGVFRKKSVWKVKNGRFIINEKWSFCGLTLLRRKSDGAGSIYYWAGILPVKGKLIPEYPQEIVREMGRDTQKGGAYA